MPNTNPHVEARLLRPKSDREQMLERIAADCCAAWQAAKDGKTHPRHVSMAERTVNRWTRKFAEEGAFYPKLPQIIVTAPLIQRDAFTDYESHRHGAGWSVRQE